MFVCEFCDRLESWHRDETNHSLVLRDGSGCLLAEKIDGQELLVDSFAGEASTEGFHRDCVHGRSTVGACNACADIKPGMNSVHQPERIF